MIKIILGLSVFFSFVFGLNYLLLDLVPVKIAEEFYATLAYLLLKHILIAGLLLFFVSIYLTVVGKGEDRDISVFSLWRRIWIGLRSKIEFVFFASCITSFLT